MADKPNFALLIGKKLDEKEGKSKSPIMDPTAPDNSEEAQDSGVDDSEMPEGDGERMADSAVADLLSAIKSSNIPQAKQALRDFIDLQDSGSEPIEAEG